MKISSIKVGELECNCYLLENDGECLLVDPGADYDKILNFIHEKNIIGILITHSHFDHIGCVEQLTKKFHYPVYNFYNLNDGWNQIGNFSFKMIPVLGHTMDSVSFYFQEERIMITGDFLFYDTIGRCDFPESNYSEMLKSIKKIKNFSEDIKIYPGHGRMTTLDREKKYNIYFQ